MSYHSLNPKRCGKTVETVSRIMENLIDTYEAAEVLGLKVTVFRQLRRAAGLPNPVYKKSNNCLYDKNELIIFAKNNDVAKIIKDTRQKIRSSGKPIRAYNYTGNHKKKLTANPAVTPEKIIIAETMINKFLRGDFLPKKQQEDRQVELAKIRANPPKRHIVNLSDIYWCD